MSRSKSAGQPQTSNSTVEEVRDLCKRISPYIVHQWRDVCGDLGVADAVLDQIEADHVTTRMSEIAYRGLSAWIEIVGRAVSKEKLQKVIQSLGLKRAEDEIRWMSSKRMVPYMGRPATAPGIQDMPVNKQAKQKAIADRLSRPKTVGNDQESDNRKRKGPSLTTGANPLLLQITPSKPDEICEVKLKITVKGVQGIGKDEIEQTHDDFKSTKDDYKNTCYNFVKLVMANRRAHFRELQELLGFSGISVQRLTKIGFNINVFLLCSSLGAFEILHRNYVTGRLKKIVHSALVTESHLVRLNARQLELSVEMEEGMVNKYRDILVVRGPAEDEVIHPVDAIQYFQCDDDEEPTVHIDLKEEDINTFSLKVWHEGLLCKTSTIDKRCQDFNGSLKDLFMTLRILKTDDLGITCLQDLINYLRYIKTSKSITAQGTRADLIREYLAIVNIIRITTEEISEKVILVSFDETLHPDSCEAFHRLLAQLEDMLHPGWKFRADEDIAVAHASTGFEKEMFGGLLCYLPKLIRLMYAICETLTVTLDDSKEVFDTGDINIETEKILEVNNNVVQGDNTLNKGDKSIHLHDQRVVPAVSYVQTWTPA